ACHFIDTLTFLVRAPIAGVQAVANGNPGEMTITLRYQDNSVGTIHYFSSGHRSYPKEQLTVLAEGRVYVLNDFRSLRGYGVKGLKSIRLWSQDKGHRREIDAFLSSVRKGTVPAMSFESIVNVTLASFAAIRAAETGRLEKL